MQPKTRLEDTAQVSIANHVMMQKWIQSKSPYREVSNEGMCRSIFYKNVQLHL